MTKKDPRYASMSMGCQVERTVCSYCGDTEVVIPDRPLLEEGMGPRFLAFSVVPAPKCEVCSTSMVYTKRSTQWACQNEACGAHGVPVETGIGGVMGELK